MRYEIFLKNASLKKDTVVHIKYRFFVIYIVMAFISDVFTCISS